MYSTPSDFSFEFCELGLNRSNTALALSPRLGALEVRLFQRYYWFAMLTHDFYVLSVLNYGGGEQR